MKAQVFYSFFRKQVLFGLLLCSIASFAKDIERDCVFVNDSLIKLLQKGQKLKEIKKYDEAIVIFNKALGVTAEKGLSKDAGFIYKSIGGIYYSKKEFDNSKNYYKKSVSVDSISQSAADVYFNLALIYNKQKLPDSLLLYLHRSLNIYNSLEDSEIKFSTYSKAGILLKRGGHYDLAISYLLKAYEGFDDLKNESKKASICNTIASTQRLLGNLDIAEQYYREALMLRERIGDSVKLAHGYNNFANLLKTQKKYDSASLYYNKAISMQDQLHKTNELGKYYYNLGTVNYLKKDFNLADRNYRRSIHYKKIEGDSLSLTSSYKELAMVAIEQGQHALARNHLDSASRTLSPNQNQDVLLRYYEVQSAYFKSIGDFENSLHYHELESSLYQNLFEERQAKAIQELQERFESKQKLQKIDKLTKGTLKQKEIITTQGDSIWVRNLLLMISLVLILLGVALYFLLKQRHKTKEKGLEIHRLESIFKEQEVIKAKISKDLHDIVTTSFDGIRLKILALPNTPNPETVGNKIVQDIAHVNEEIRLISHRLSPLGDKIKDNLLSDIILSQLTEFQYYRKIFINVQLPLPDEINHFRITSQTNLYGIILEALNNIEKHSQATEAIIKHEKDGDLLRITISDNGIGFQNKDKNGVGLLNMRQRSELLEGTCTISSTDNGTTVEVSFPIKLNMK